MDQRWQEQPRFVVRLSKEDLRIRVMYERVRRGNGEPASQATFKCGRMFSCISEPNLKDHSQQRRS